MHAYDTVYREGSGEIVEKKSRFIAEVYPVSTEEEATELIEKTKKQYWDARHHCYAFILGEDGTVSRCSDDGEPSGTAGRPILEVLSGRNLRNVLVIVTRYFGGTLLGTGGLVRAYSEAAREGLKNCQIITKQYGKRLHIITDYNGIGKLQYVIAGLDIPVEDTVYADKVTMKVFVSEELCEKVEKELTEATAGQAELRFEKEGIYFAVIGKDAIVF